MNPNVARGFDILAAIVGVAMAATVLNKSTGLARVIDASGRFFTGSIAAAKK